MTTSTDPYKFFPVPSAPESKYIPSWVGFNPKSTATLIKVLEDNHKRWHIFHNDRGHHNHSAHRAIALWSLGADADVIQAGYDADCSFQRPAIEPPEQITAGNFNDYLGNKSSYSAYLAFFENKIKEKGVTASIEEYVFSRKANFEVEGSEKPHPAMLDRFMGGLLHPLIHTGYGLEFGLPGMVAEGLAEAAVGPLNDIALIPDSFITAETNSLLETIGSGPYNSTSPSVHAFTILARVLNDPEFSGLASKEGMTAYSDTMQVHGTALANHLKDWYVDISNPLDISRKMEELMWVNVIIYGIGGWEAGKNYNAEFCYMHLVTSSIFLGSYIAHLTPESQGVLLRSYFLVSLGWWVTRGCADLDIKAFFKSTSAYPVPSGKLPTPDDSALLSLSSPKVVTPNPWSPIIETSLVHPDDHLIKLQRALLHYSSLFGSRPPGLYDFKDTELPGAENIDGSLFIRVAGLTATRMGRVREGERRDIWDRIGFHRS